jgi:hypothetical protein
MGYHKRNYLQVNIVVGGDENIMKYLSKGENGNYQMKKKRSILGFFKGKS